MQRMAVETSGIKRGKQTFVLRDSTPCGDLWLPGSGLLSGRGVRTAIPDLSSEAPLLHHPRPDSRAALQAREHSGATPGGAETATLDQAPMQVLRRLPQGPYFPLPGWASPCPFADVSPLED